MKNLHTTSSIQIDFNDPTEFKFSFSFVMTEFSEGIFMHSAAARQYKLCDQFSRSVISLMDG